MNEESKKERKHANFFEGGTKSLKEKFVTKAWLNTYGGSHGYNEEALFPLDDQWPDCEISTISGELCGIEVTELVDTDCIRQNQKGANLYRHWTNEEIIEAIEARLKIKNTKSHGGKYIKLIVLIHTDEFEIQFNDCNEAIEKHCFAKLENIDEAYLLYSYDPKYQKYPVSILNLRS